MKDYLTYFEIYHWINENKDLLVNSFVKDVKYFEKTFDFKLYKKGFGTYHLIVCLPNFIFLDKQPIRNLKMHEKLKKEIENKKVLNIESILGERIVKIEFDDKYLFIELFHNGNLVLTDKNLKIIYCFECREFKDRKILINEIYKFPPKKYFFDLSFFEILKIFNQDVEIEKFLANIIGKDYSDYVLSKCKIDKNVKCKDLKQNEIEKIINEIKDLEKNFEKAYLYKIDSEYSFFIRDFLNFEKNVFEKINDAIKILFKIYKEKEKKKSEEEIRKKVEKILKERERKIKEIESEIEKIGKIIEEIKMHYNEIESLRNFIFENRKIKSWFEIKKEIFEKFKFVKNVNEKNAKITLCFNNFEFEYDFRKSVNEFLNELYEKRKKLKEKIGKIEKTELPKIEVEKEKVIEEKEKKEWYEKFRWFISSDGYLVVSGKDAETNEILIKKYARDYDLILHTDLPGSPFTVIRNDKKDVIPAQTIYEAAQFTACYSKAWLFGLSVANVFYVNKNQLKKLNLPKGSFFVEGQKNWIENVKLRLSIGVKIENEKIRIFAAPPVAARKISFYIKTIIPGNRSAKEIAKEIKEDLIKKIPFEYREKLEKISESEIEKLIPYGKAELVKEI